MVLPSGYSGTPLAKKLGIKEGFRVYFVNLPRHYFQLFKDVPEIEVMEGPESGAADFIHVFCTELGDLEVQLGRLKPCLKKNGALWISWPKGSSMIPNNLDGNLVRRHGLLEGLVDVKVCAIDADWSGLKFMYRLKDRK